MRLFSGLPVVRGVYDGHALSGDASLVLVANAPDVKIVAALLPDA